MLANHFFKGARVMSSYSGTNLGFKINFHNKSKCILHVRLISIKQNPLNFDGITRNSEIRCLKNF